MNYATDYTVILTALYVLIIAIAYAPKSCKVSPVEKVDCFPEPTEPEPIKTAIATEPIETAHFNPVTDLTTLTIRQLKKLASEAKIKRYNVMKKGELILALS